MNSVPQDKLKYDTPFPVKASQVEGGAEFMAEFENACQTKGIALYVCREAGK